MDDKSRMLTSRDADAEHSQPSVAARRGNGGGFKWEGTEGVGECWSAGAQLGSECSAAAGACVSFAFAVARDASCRGRARAKARYGTGGDD